MRLSELHSSAINRFSLQEEVDPAQQEKLGYLQMMVARQGVDPDQFMNRVKGLVQPGFAKQAGAKMTLSRWLGDAQSGDSKDGISHGRKIRITVLESEVRELITEGVFRGVGHMIVSKLRDIIGGDRQEHQLLTTALDTNPGLTAIVRYARRADDFVYDDPKFWELVDGMTGGRAQLIKRIVHSSFERLEESKQRFDVLTECEITEARISRVMAELGLDQETIEGLMQQFDIRDEDYDIDRLKGVGRKAKELPKKMMGGIEKAGAGMLQKAKELGGKVKGMASGAMDAATSYRMQQENEDFAEEVVKVAHALMQLDAADADTPEEAEEVLDRALSPEQEAEEPIERPEVVSPQDLRQEVGV